MAKIWIRKINAKGQVTIPAELRKQLGLRPGGSVVVLWQQDGCIMLQSLTSWNQQRRSSKKQA